MYMLFQRSFFCVSRKEWKSIGGELKQKTAPISALLTDAAFYSFTMNPAVEHHASPRKSVYK
jgi:hypothetical protein